MKIVQYNTNGNSRPWDGAPGYHHFALLHGSIRFTNFKTPVGISNNWSQKGASYLNSFRLEFIY